MTSTNLELFRGLWAAPFPICGEKSRLLLQQLLNCRNNLGGVRGYCRFESCHDVAFAVHQELGKVPLDLSGHCCVGLLGEKQIERSRVIPFLTETLANMGKVTLYLVEQKVLISAFVPGSCAPKLLAGKPSITNPWSLYFS